MSSDAVGPVQPDRADSSPQLNFVYDQDLGGPAASEILHYESPQKTRATKMKWLNEIRTTLNTEPEKCLLLNRKLALSKLGEEL